MHQDYRNYDAVAVIDSKSDSAYRSIRRAGIRHLIADFDCTGSAKVRALCTAIDKFPNYPLYCIADSDVCAPSGWLSSLVKRMTSGTGIVTSFPIFEPVGGFWSRVKNVWGFVGIGLMENERTRFGWGGTLLFRRKLLDGDGMRLFSASVSDDIALTRLAKKRGLGIEYAAEARPVVKTEDTRAQFFEWSTRQTKFSITGDRRMLYYGLGFYSASLLLLVSGLLLSLLYSYLCLIFLLPFLMGLAKTMRRAGRLDAVIVPVYFCIYAVYLYNIIAASRMEGVTWRGRYYRVESQD